MRVIGGYMNTLDAFKNRRSYYAIDDNIKVSDDEIVKFIKEAVRLVPDAMGRNTQNVVIVMGNAHKKLWDDIYDVYGGQVSREKIDGFKAGYGTVLFLYDQNIVDENIEKYPLYKENFLPWAYQANGMLQISVWNGLTEMGLGVNLQHYNPIIDEMVHKELNIDSNMVLLAQMVFGNPIAPPDPKEKSAEGRVRAVK